ncbi:MAG: hypothetical protein Q8S33_00095 [Myxococcales bacterium]|nr:hypothetical protein [Myxococcales bacterium]
MRASLVLVASLLGCRDPLLVGALEPLSVPDVVDCGRALVGSSTACSFQVVSGGPARLSRVALQGEFTGPAEVELVGGENRLTLQFQPQRAGPAEGLITLGDEHHLAGIRLVGTGVAPWVCAREPCRQRTFDLETGQCVTTNEPDGTSCAAERCIIEGVCAAGHCVGPPRSCDDGNPCTVDSCSSTQGCLHEARVCPASTNPCEAPVCDATSGCGFSPVIDGTACGVSDCRTAPICLSGHCELRAAPIGSTCGAASACRSAGQCLADGTCGPGKSTSPRVAWRFSPPAGRRVVWWTTTHGGKTSVVTENTQGSELWLQVFDANGLVELSVDLSAEDSTIASVSTVLDDDTAVLCVVTQHGPRRETQVSCRDRRTGARLWQRALSSLAIPVNDPMNGRANFLLQRIAARGQGDVLLLVMEGHQTHTLHAIALEGATGTTTWRVQRHGHGRLFVGRSGEAWLTSRPCSGQTQSVTRISSTGQTLHERVVPWALRAMAGDTPIVTTPNQVLQLAPDGSARQVSTHSAEPWAVLWEDDVLTMNSRTAAGTSDLVRVELDGGVRFTVPLGSSSVLQLITDGGVATSTSHPDGGFTLRLYSATGALFEACELAVPAYRISSGRAFGSTPQGLVVYELPGIGAAPSGWPNIDGFNGTFRAR